jgi:hypothetical protein
MQANFTTGTDTSPVGTIHTPRHETRTDNRLPVTAAPHHRAPIIGSVHPSLYRLAPAGRSLLGPPRVEIDINAPASTVNATAQITDRPIAEVVDNALFRAGRHEPYQAARAVAADMRHLGLANDTVLKLLPDEMRLPFFLEQMRFVDMAAGDTVPASTLALIPLYRDADPADRVAIGQQLTRAATLVRQLETTSGHPKRQEQVMDNMHAFARVRTNDRELSDMMFTAIASNFESFHSTKSHALKLLDTFFKSPAHDDAAKAAKTDALSGLLLNSIRHAGSNHTVKEIVNAWRDQMNEQWLTAEQRHRLTLDLISVMPDMEASLQLVTSKYSPQAKALKYIKRLLDHVPLMHGGYLPPRITPERRAELHTALARLDGDVDTVRRNLTREGVLRTGNWNPLITGALLDGMLSFSGGVVVQGVIGQAAVAAAGGVLAVSATAAPLIAGGALLAAGAALSVRRVYQRGMSQSNQTRLREIIDREVTDGRQRNVRTTEPPTIAHHENLRRRMPFWEATFKNFARLEPSRQFTMLDEFLRETHSTATAVFRQRLCRNLGPAYVALAEALPHMEARVQVQIYDELAKFLGKPKSPDQPLLGREEFDAIDGALPARFKDNTLGDDPRTRYDNWSFTGSAPTVTWKLSDDELVDSPFLDNQTSLDDVDRWGIGGSGT